MFESIMVAASASVRATSTKGEFSTSACQEARVDGHPTDSEENTVYEAETPGR